MIRAATPDDADAIGEFDVMGGDRRAEALENRMWVAVDAAGKPVGYASVARCRFHQNPYVEFLVVREESRRAGIAARLLEAIEHANPGARLFISVEEPNETMLRLVLRRGYTRSGALQGLNDDHGGAAEVFFYRDLSSRPTVSAFIGNG